ncbi:hypothetical protein TWF730_007979 [Orbilia blumenaviensis]|uniref:Uncharacterized protein n=1 Tax=Orbilia blumenaviensis TaxID=1796055 RepID=A0AAV9VCN2_9PEZI
MRFFKTFLTFTAVTASVVSALTATQIQDLYANSGNNGGPAAKSGSLSYQSRFKSLAETANGVTDVASAEEATPIIVKGLRSFLETTTSDAREIRSSKRLLLTEEPTVLLRWKSFKGAEADFAAALVKNKEHFAGASDASNQIVEQLEALRAFNSKNRQDMIRVSTSIRQGMAYTSNWREVDQSIKQAIAALKS